MKLNPYLAIILAATLGGSSGVFIKLLDLPSTTITFFRLFVPVAIRLVYFTWKKVKLFHGDFKAYAGPEYRYLLPGSPAGFLDSTDDFDDVDVVLFGHSHVQFQFLKRKVLFYNPGSVGQPRLGKVQATYAVYEGGSFRHRAAGYDITPVLRRLSELPLPEHMTARAQERIRSGFYWPEEPWTDLARDGYE